MLKYLFILTSLLVATGNLRAATPRFCLPGDPAGFNPQVANDEATLLATRPLYDRLVELHAVHRSGRAHAVIEPGLAASWEMAHDGRTYTFQLRHGVRFHQTSYFTPTRTLDADDVVFSFNRARLSAHPFHMVGGGVYPDFASSGLAKNLAQVEKVNEHAVRFHLNQADPDFLGKLARDGANILSAEYGETVLSKGTAWELDRMPIGTGPYQFEKYERTKSIHYVANTGYFRAHSPTTALVYAIVPVGMRAEKVRTGDCSAGPGFVFP